MAGSFQNLREHHANPESKLKTPMNAVDKLFSRNGRKAPVTKLRMIAHPQII